ncbi:hypothetical protein AC579_6883 [Pseudocercospora musae]|uniref:Postreplication repair E3 ubiquitin-protein ligase RAD18 n=1 Tax=Pseudocercospora musae TaxID=113226 RepID=A0A139IGY2_9PEZI|nr:hypothetical protein AC579_6883 [Pseudocercospora musae]
MDSSYDVPDSTDWIGTSIPDLAALENALHCQICKEFYDTPMITTCNHTFCSRCIRTSLSSDGKCPACRASDQASKLRNNWAIQEVVATFINARPKALEVARKAHQEVEQPKRNGKRKRTALQEADEAMEAETSSRTTRSKTRRIANSRSSQPEAIEIDDSEDGADEAFQPDSESEPGDGLVACPLGCGKRMKEEEVFNHLDKCEDEQKQAAKTKPKTNLKGVPSKTPSRQNSRPQDRINELSYGMLKETALAKKLKEQGLPNFGSKQLLISRHKEWVNIWNANCDSNDPRSRRDLLRDLDVWERTQGGKAPQGNVLSGSVMRKDFDGASYAKRHHDDFSRLIADAKRKKSVPATEKEQPKYIGNSVKAETNDDGKSPLFSSNSQLPTRSEQGSRQEPQGQMAAVSGDPKPYEHDAEALSNLRDKVNAINEGKTVESQHNEGFRLPTSDIPATETKRISNPSLSLAASINDRPQCSPNKLPPSMFENATLQRVHSTAPSGERSRASSKDEHIIQERSGSACDIPAHLTASSPKKVPMFAVPEQPFKDVDTGGTSASPGGTIAPVMGMQNMADKI